MYYVHVYLPTIVSKHNENILSVGSQWSHAVEIEQDKDYSIYDWFVVVSHPKHIGQSTSHPKSLSWNMKHSETHV